ncbi:MAG: anti-sigma factor domain-containing protein, partial [Vicinamibacteraceae bacterium]
CPECAREVRALLEVVHALGRAVPDRDPPAALRERVLAAAGAASRGLPPARTPPPAVRRGRPWQWLAAAAALAALVLALYAVMLRGRVGALDAELAAVRAQLTVTERDAAEARRSAADLQRAMAILRARDVAAVSLAGQPPAASARGRAFWSASSGGVLFIADDLPALPRGRVYQLWVVTTKAPVSLALLTPDPSGATAAVTAPPTDAVPIAFAVTIEPEGGVPAPTGAKYLVGAF